MPYCLDYGAVSYTHLDVYKRQPLLHNDMDRFRDLVIGDIRWCKENGVDYVPAVTPGFSWHNLSKLEFPDDVKPVGSIPRRCV